MKNIFYTFVFISISLFFLNSCDKAVKPDSTSFNEQLTYKMVLVSEVIPGTFRDSIRLTFRPDSTTWNHNFLNQPYLLLVYKSNGNADQRLVKKQLVGAGGTETFVSYRDTLLNLRFDSVLVSDSRESRFPSDSSVGGYFTYTTVVVANVSRVGNTSTYEKGFVGVSSISNAVSTGEGLGLSLAAGATETAVNPVYFSAVIPKQNVFMVVAHKYSALQPVLSADTILSYSKKNNRDTVIQAGTTLYGYISKPDTFYIHAPNSKLTLDSSNADELKLSGYVTLARGYGRKHVVIQCFNSGGTALGSLLWDDIAIKASHASIRFDFDMANRDSFFIDEIRKNVCVLSRTIPIVFDSYGDTSLDSNVFIWIATRKAAAKFFNDGSFDNSDMTYSSKATFNWGDCIFETKPQEFFLNSSGKVRERILAGFDYQNGYRISPLATVKKNDPGGWKSTNFGSAIAISQAGIKRSDKVPEIVSRLVKKGSILGYDSTTLDSFSISRVCVSHPDSLAVTGEALSWFTAIPFSSLKDNGYSSVQQYISSVKPGFTGDATKIFNSLSLAYSIDYSDNLYQHPFRGIPVTSSAVKEGTKEFIIIVLARGKYFGENRVYYSSTTFNYSLVWDEIPPQIKWSVNSKDNTPYYSPLQTFKYAPMCYPQANRCTDFSQFKSGLFDVYLSTNPPLDRSCSIRDVGFGKIKTVKLMFNYSAEFISSDPFTGIRKYLAPDVVIELSPDIIANQKKETYYSGTKALGSSYALYDIAFRNIDFSSWRAGMWDMWFQTEDDLGNVGLAPYAGDLSLDKGEVSIRQIEIK